MSIAVVDTSIFLLFFEKRFDAIEHLDEDLDEKVICATTDSVMRELHTHITERIRGDVVKKYLERIYEKCKIYTLSEDYEKEDADQDLIRLASIYRGYIATLDKDLKKIAKEDGIKLIIYRESKNMLEIE
ncbi:MAG: hypothetical protein RQ885_12990 [Desulfurococcales archaeon]|jgi:rRNA-processing protein FCF1|nr:hypothetical protein [Desulfurococcales archaeon]